MGQIEQDIGIKNLMSTGLMEHSNTVQQHVNRWSPVINDPKSGEFVGQGGIGG
jgi:hypothetical protein